MSVFPTTRHLASWAGTAPRVHRVRRQDQIDEDAARQSAPEGRAPGLRFGRVPLEAHVLLGEVPAARRAPGSDESNSRRAALDAHRRWNMLTNGDLYRDPGADYFTTRKPAKTKALAVGQLEALGYRVTLEPLADTA